MPPLIDLLVGSDALSQVCAAGALLNLLGPDLSEVQSHPKRVALRKLVWRRICGWAAEWWQITSALVMGMVYHGLFSPEVE